ncbi:transcription factor S-II, central domain-containing protein [Entophlyctis helioformis]|nr:transcription factor S-II, central domain-containing protein [Entophlyctis helioformis]
MRGSHALRHWQTPAVKRKRPDAAASKSNHVAADPNLKSRGFARQNLLDIFKAMFEWAKTKPAELGNGDLHESIDLDDPDKLAMAVEEALFDSTATAKNGTLVAGDQYKAKCRSLIFNLKDQTNVRLRRRVLTKGSLHVDATALVRLSPEDLASEVVRAQADRVHRESLKNAFVPRAGGPPRLCRHGRLWRQVQEAAQGRSRD